MYIYGLCEPETGYLRYIGVAENPRKRFRNHMQDKSNSHKVNWIKSLKDRGLLPELFIVEEISEVNWQREERFWISYFRSIGCNLVNATEGGDGIRGFKFSAESKKKISLRLLGNNYSKGKPWSEESRNKIKGRKISDAQRKKISLAQKGKLRPNQKMSEIGKAAVAASNRLHKHHLGQHHSQKTKALISAANASRTAETKERVSQAIADSNRRRALLFRK